MFGALYRGADRALGGYLPGAHRPLHETAADFVGDGINSATDILSGNRDRRYNREEAEKAYERQRELIRDKAGLEMEGLSAAGINPTLAGSGFSGGVPSVHQASHSGSGSGLAGAINSAGSIISSITNLRKMIAELPKLQADTRKTNADANFVEQSTPGNLDNIGLRGRELEANTARSVAERGRIEADTFLKKLDRSRAEAESDFYKRYGRGAVLADKMKNPWQSAQLMAHPVGDAVGAVNRHLEPALNSAVDVAAKSIRRSAENEAKRTQHVDKRKSPISGRHYMNWR